MYKKLNLNRSYLDQMLIRNHCLLRQVMLRRAAPRILRAHSSTTAAESPTAAPGGYNPDKLEKDWYNVWLKKGIFTPDASKATDPSKVFCIPAPPPNVTGALHIGHALTISLQDSLVRYNRMKGKTVLFLPGFDHAGIATQSVVEKQLYKKEGKTRHDYEREKFISKVWDWKDLYHEKIKSQIQKMGGSYDWTREAFTLNPQLSKAVTEAFVRLHDEGVIYRDSRLINWCVKLNTAISNLEVESKEIKGKTMLKVPGYEKTVPFGVLTSIAYEIVDADDQKTGEKLVVSTTRPETIFGDTAIAIHPDDPRYKHLHGQRVQHPLLERKIPIILDAEIVDMEFGTGAVKITPAHDINDYKCGKRHDLPFINILSDDGLLNGNCGKEWQGMKRFDARDRVIEELRKHDLFVSEKDHAMTIPICSRSGDVIEPLLKPQWWVSQESMAKDALDAVKNGKIKIQPAHSKEDYFRWLNKIDDWCISRQLWWGHRCPVYFINIDQCTDKDARSSNDYWVAARDLKEAEEKASKRFPGIKFTLEQDNDVLDTWFSSALWPFSTLGWPDKTIDLKTFYPFSLLETGWDILFFWVARMVMMGIKLTGEVPFKEVFCHPLIRDAQGRKMSKSLGNVIDPVDVINGATLKELESKLLTGNLDPREVKVAMKGLKMSYPKGIPQCGTDALRFALCSYTSNDNPNDINLDINKVETYRKFCNKMFQATNFTLMKVPSGKVFAVNDTISNKLSLNEKYILYSMNETAGLVSEALESRHFLNATEAIYKFWYQICDVYIEYFKFVLKTGSPESIASAEQTLITVIDNGLRMIHPMMPFISEELWQKLPIRRSTDTICLSSYPEYSAVIDSELSTAKQLFDQVLAVVSETRGLLNQYNIRKNGVLYLECIDNELGATFQHEMGYILNSVKICKAPITVVGSSSEVPVGCVSKALNSQVTLHLLIKGQVSDAEGDIKKLETKIGKLGKKRGSIEKITQNPNYSRAADHVRAANETALRDLDSQIKSYALTVSNLRKYL